MTKQQALKLFEERRVRTVWDDEQEKWYFSIVDVVAVLTDSSNPQTYWRVLKKRLLSEGNETVTNCNAPYRCCRYRTASPPYPIYSFP